MKRFPVLLALFCAGLLAASLAAAKPPPGKGKPEGKGKKTTTSSTDPETCKPKIAVILKGTFVSGGGTSFRMDVKQTNFHGRELVGKPLTLMTDDQTKYRRNGHAELSDFEAGDRLNVQARTCKAKKPKNGTTTTTTTQAPAAQAAPMLAKRVVGQPAKASAGGTTTTTTTP
jgi:hypothetical protein